MKCFAMEAKCSFCDEKISTYPYRDKYGGYCSKVCRMIDLEDSLIKQKQKIRGMLA